MSLNAKDKAAVKALWAKVSKSTDAIGSETLSRLFCCYPQTKTYFTHWSDLSPGSAPIMKHGKLILAGVSLAVKNIDDINKGLLELSEKHAFQLRVDPSNFKLMAHCLMVVICMLFPNDFTPEAHVAFDKFMNNVALGLSERFR
ncbi:hemoglobin, alpha embryonic 5 [Periophthalmus magnuspinnatus]|uniref:Globin domain-containing protein n=1 Tax=Periophthalmus magnuspinnatus TaxID=409849 RepID=A0A3B4A3T4_9GOBI|nr:hemoglobin, alpha embryonic 5 [Periophthalmus magnuspinnatus]